MRLQAAISQTRTYRPPVYLKLVCVGMDEAHRGSRVARACLGYTWPWRQRGVLDWWQSGCFGSLQVGHHRQQ